MSPNLHDDARSTLATWRPPKASQDRLRRAYLSHLAAHPDALSRECHPDHLTASVLIFSSDHARVLLTLHKRLGRWLQTGGHCEPDDHTIADAALREGREESGIRNLSIDPLPVWLSLHEVPCGPIRPSHHLDVQFIAVAPPKAHYVISDESEDLQWFALDELPASTDDSVRALTAAGARRLRENP